MSIILGFTIFVMVLLLGYMGYRLFLRRKLLLLGSFCLQIFAISIAVIGFLNDVYTNEIMQACYVGLGIVIPGAFFVYDYVRMMKKVKDQGVYDGFIEHLQINGNEVDTNFDKKHISPLIKERQVPELVRDLNLNKDDILKNIKKNLSQSQAFLNGRDYENAADIYRTLLKLIKNCPGLYYNYGNLCYYKGNYAEAVQSYKRVLEINEELIKEINTPQEVFSVVKSRKDPGKDILNNPKTEADIKYEEFMVFYNLGNAHFKLNRFDQAIESYKKALEINPNLEEAYENIARSLIALERKEDAIEYYMKVVEGDKSNYRVHYIIGKLYSELKRYSDSVKELKECLNLESSYIEAYEALGDVLSRWEKYAEAAEVFKKLIKLKPQDYKVYYNVGTSLYHMGLKEEAVDYFKRVIEINPESYKSYYNMAIALDEIGQQEEAIIAFKKVIELKLDFVDAYNNLGILFSTLGRRLEALDVYTKGLKKNPEESSLYYNMGITLSEMGRYTEAIEVYKSALEIKPDEYEIYYHLGGALAQIKKYGESIDAYKNAMKVKPADSELFYSLSVVYSIIKKYDISIDNLRKAIELNDKLKEEAKCNRAFDSMRTKAEFRDLVS